MSMMSVQVRHPCYRKKSNQEGAAEGPGGRMNTLRAITNGSLCSCKSTLGSDVSQHGSTGSDISPEKMLHCWDE